MNAVLELIYNCQKLVRDVSCLTAEGRLYQTTVAKAIFVRVSMWQGSNSKLILRIMQIVKSNHITPRNEFRG